ncbi:hypothetical protein GCM10007036_18470 [Alsobacter metallidurans]|uniref:Glycosyltransferase 2-like domain-containing protein n=1 Tax=Alsobacter metallidurans TaxID=340221 RepID=A0A917I6X5_9HYPH|nr:glycosyltransferase [Alsobacter metallidurans]GGH17193.1 hypothetical protein GCM10007036_18470 [Alsobacter metallidurans]
MARCEIIIVGYRCEDDIVQCLHAIYALEGGDVSVRICENGGSQAYASLISALTEVFGSSDTIPSSSKSLDEGRRFAGAVPICAYLAAGNLGYAGGVNAILDVLEGDPDWEAVWVLNPDTQPRPGALKALRERAQDGAYGAVGSRIILKRSNTVQMYAGRWRRWMARGYNIGLGASADATIDPADVEANMQYISGASMYVTRSFINTVGRMDERYFLYAEEVDWFFRKGHFKLGYAHDAIVDHAHGATLGSSHDRRSRSSLSVYLDERSKLLLTRRFFPRQFPVVAVSTFLLAAQYLKAGAYKNYRVALAGWWAGLRGETGFPPSFAPKPYEMVTSHLQQK